jgi:hypothetical protein
MTYRKEKKEQQVHKWKWKRYRQIKKDEKEKRAAKKTERKSFKEWLEEDGAPANAMGTSSSTPGAGGIDTFDPLLFRKPFRRNPPEINKRKTKR